MISIRKVIILLSMVVIVGSGCGSNGLTDFGNPGPTESCQNIATAHAYGIPTVEVQLPDGDGKIRTVCLAGYAPEWLP